MWLRFEKPKRLISAFSNPRLQPLFWQLQVKSTFFY
jgi:hypothetical protein